MKKTYLYNGHVVTASNKKEVLNPKRVVARDKWHLKDIIEEAIDKYGYKCDLNFIDVSNIKDLSCVFSWFGQFNGDISKWDVSNATNMSEMFYDSDFNGDISNWNVSKVEDMSNMFWDSKFNGDISKWDVSNVKDMEGMFKYSKFNGDISKWDVSNVEVMSEMFFYSRFNGDISKWNVSKVYDMSDMFYESKFYGNISKWLPMMKKNGIDIRRLKMPPVNDYL